MHVLPLAMRASFSAVAFMIPELPKRGRAVVTGEIHIAPMPTVATARPAEGNELLPAKTDNTVATVSTYHLYLSSVYHSTYLLVDYSMINLS